jgi:hypothetical protein
VAETSDKVAKDLQGIFGDIDSKRIDEDGEDDKKKKRKRSSDDMTVHQGGADDKSHRQTKVEIERQPASTVDNDKKRNVKRSAANDDEEDEPDNENGNFGDFPHISVCLNTKCD